MVIEINALGSVAGLVCARTLTAQGASARPSNGVQIRPRLILSFDISTSFFSNVGRPAEIARHRHHENADQRRLRYSPLPFGSWFVLPFVYSESAFNTFWMAASNEANGRAPTR